MQFPKCLEIAFFCPKYQFSLILNDENYKKLPTEADTEGIMVIFALKTTYLPIIFLLICPI